MQIVRRAIVVSLSTLALCAASSGAEPSWLVPLEPCAVARFPARCGTLEVAENRSEPSARRLPIRVVVIPARLPGERHEDPLLVLEGGPGASVLETAPRHTAYFGDLHARRDFVFVEQRGTGESGPLDCGLAAGVGLGLGALDPGGVADCRERLGERADLRFYGTHHAVADLIDVLDALGYQRANVFAISYGTRTALELVRRHPERVRAVALLGTYPPGRNAVLDSSALLDRSLELLASACLADGPCRRAFPELRESIATLSARLGSDGFEASRLEVGSALRRLLLNSLTAKEVPRAVSAAARGDLSVLRSASGAASAILPAITDGAYLSLLCSEDVARLGSEEIQAAGRETLLRGSWGAALVETCREWPRAEVPEDFHAPLDAATPILSLTGELDPVLLPSWGAELASSLPRARHLTIPRALHELLGMLGIGCIADLVRAFVEEGSARDLDESCLRQVRMQPFTLP